MTSSSRPTSIGATRARQGRWGRHMLWVLLFGTLLGALGLFAAWTWKAPQLAASNSNNGPSKSAAQFHTPEPAAIVPENGAKPGAPTP